MGILKQSREQGAGLSKVEREVTVSAFCRRRLAVVMVRTGMVQTVKAVSFCSILDEGRISDRLLTLAVGCYVRRRWKCPCWKRGRHRSCFPGHEEYGGLCHLGGQQ